MGHDVNSVALLPTRQKKPYLYHASFKGEKCVKMKCIFTREVAENRHRYMVTCDSGVSKQTQAIYAKDLRKNLNGSKLIKQVNSKT